jgi:hypothetical protein
LALLLEITNRAGNHGRQREVIELLVAAGARVEPQWLDSQKVRADPADGSGSEARYQVPGKTRPNRKQSLR